MLNGFRHALVDAVPTDQLRFCVTVPVRNEETLLPRALHALSEQKDSAGRELPAEQYEVILLINNSQDRSRQIAEHFLANHPRFNLHIVERNFADREAHIGHVRRLLMDEGCTRLGAVGNPNSLILTTDSDSYVAPNWIVKNYEEVAAGAEAVGGRILLRPAELAKLPTLTRALYEHDELYRHLIAWLETECDPESHDSWPRHHQQFGASLAVTPRAYKLVGGLPPHRFLEDIAFYQALIKRDIPFRHSNKVRVFTSARLSGRSNVGLSWQLREWENNGEDESRLMVESAAFLEYLFNSRHRLRTVWKTVHGHEPVPDASIAAIALMIGIKPDLLRFQLNSAPYFGLLLEQIDFYETCRKSWPDDRRLAPLKNAVREMLSKFKRTRRTQLVTAMSSTLRGSGTLDSKRYDLQECPRAESLVYSPSS